MKLHEDSMVWARIDDAILDNPKVVRAGPLGFALHVAAITWCCRNLTDGLLLRAKVPALLGLSHEEVEATVAKLISSGLWLARDDDTYEIHDFLAYNFSKEQVLAERERGKRRADESRARKRSPERSPEVRPNHHRTFAGGSPEVRRLPYPDPDPVSRSEDPDQIPSVGSPEGAAELTASGSTLGREQDYQRAYERGVAAGKGSPFAMPERQRGELHQGILAHGFGADGTKLRGDRLLRWLELQARQFAEFVTYEARKDPRAIDFHSGYGPRGWLKWLNVTPTIPIVDSKIARAGSRMPLVASGVPGQQPANENASEPNVGALVANLVRGWKP